MKSNLKKSLLAAMLASAGMGAQADGLGFYALLDAGIVGNSFTAVPTNASQNTKFMTGGYAPNFVGVKGEKSLEKGYSAGFNLEQGFLLDSNASTGGNNTGSSRFAFGGSQNDSFANRQANLYINGSMGKLTLGTQGNIAFNSLLMVDARIGSNYGSSLGSVVIDGGLATIDVGAINYTSPAMSGFTVSATYAPDSRNLSTTPVTSTNGNAISLVYKGGDFAATAAAYTNNTFQTSVTTSQGAIYGATYKMGDFLLKGLLSRQTSSTYKGLTTTGLGGDYTVNPKTTIDLGMYRSADGDTTVDYGTTTFGVGVRYKFLKDLTAYAQYANVKNTATRDAAYNFTWVDGLSRIVGGATASSYNVGLLYSFF